LFTDKGAQRLICNTGVHHSKPKYIDLEHYFIWNHCTSDAIKLQHIFTNKMPANISTKGLPRQKHT